MENFKDTKRRAYEALSFYCPTLTMVNILPDLFFKTALMSYNSQPLCHLFKLYNPVVFSIFSDMCNYYHSPF